MPENAIVATATDIVAKGSMHSTFGDSLLVTLVGMAVVFMGLVILICLIKVLARATENMGKPKKNKKAAEEAAAPAPVVPEPVVEEVEEDDLAVIAVISAAVACMMEEGSAFTVRHIRRIPAKK